MKYIKITLKVDFYEEKNLALALIEFFRGGPENFSGDFTETQINSEEGQGGPQNFPRPSRANLPNIDIMALSLKKLLFFAASLLCFISLLYSRVLIVSGSDVTDKVRTFHMFREDVIKHIF